MMSLRKRLIWCWSLALLLPFILMFLVQIPLCVVEPLSRYVGSLKPHHVFIPITLICALPSFIPFVLVLKPSKALWINLVLALLIVTPLMIPVWVSGLVVSHKVFDRCTENQTSN